MADLQRHEVDMAASFGNSRKGCHLRDFLNYHDEEFVAFAYRGVLNRDPNAQEVEHSLVRLRSGTLGKAEILGGLRYSQEGRAKGIEIKGLFWPFLIQSSYKIPVLGYVIRLTVGIFNLPTILRNLQILEASVFAQSKTQEKGAAAGEPVTLPPAEVPVIKIADLLPNPVRITLCDLESVDGNISVLELVVLNSLIRKACPKACFEIGTFDGRTVLNLAANMELGTEIYTLDLPAAALTQAAFRLEEADKKYIDKEQSGMRFEHTPYAERITQLFGDSAAFDYSDLQGRMEFIFIDGSHSYEYVISDSKTALRLLAPNGGTIMWHDYGTPYWPGVTQALNELNAENPLFGEIRHIQDTSLCILEVASGLAEKIGEFFGHP